uniref:Uncharacterized protein n=1 Tax=Anguilla anguilla TaxID=7936 RepID=A0A0E9W8M6_ANGAN
MFYCYCCITLSLLTDVRFVTLFLWPVI